MMSESSACFWGFYSPLMLPYPALIEEEVSSHTATRYNMSLCFPWTAFSLLCRNGGGVDGGVRREVGELEVEESQDIKSK